MLKRLLPKSLFGRTILIIVTPLVLVQVISTWVFYDRHWDTVTRRLAGSLAGDIALIVRHLREYPNPEDRTWILDAVRFNMDIRATLRRGEELPAASAGAGGSTVERMLGRALKASIGQPYAIDMDSRAREVVIDVQMPEGVLRVVTTRKRLSSVTTNIFIMWSMGSSLLLLAIATIFMRNQVRPIRRLAQAADSFGKGHDVPQFKPAGAAEVRQAAGAFITMRDRINRQMTQRTEMLAGVSHDLRTPLTRMKLQLAMIGDTPETRELRANVEEMEKTVDEYLAFARGEGTETPVNTDLSALLREVVDGARRNGDAIELVFGDAMTVPVRPTAFRRCVTNVVDNAVKYGEKVSVRATRRAGAVEIVVDDDGPGIPADQREEAFKPFARLDRSRNPDTGGVGLGLAIARDIMRGHGGDLTLGDSPMGGLRAQLWLPV